MLESRRETFEVGDVAVLRGNVRENREDFGDRATYRRLLKHVGRRCVVTADATGDGMYYDVTFTSGFKAGALSSYHLERPVAKPLTR